MGAKVFLQIIMVTKSCAAAGIFTIVTIVLFIVAFSTTGAISTMCAGLGSLNSMGAVVSGFIACGESNHKDPPLAPGWIKEGPHYINEETGATFLDRPPESYVKSR